MASNVKLRKNTKCATTEGTGAKRCCSLDKRKGPTPKASDFKNVVKVVAEPKDHVYENIVSLKNVKVGERPHIVQDSRDGHRQDASKAGLKLKYVFKKEYGEVPKYIRKKRHEQKKQENSVVVDEAAARLISDEEKEIVLQGLKNNVRQVEKMLLSLPLIIDTISKQKYKKRLEDRWLEFQKDIDTLENRKVFVSQKEEPR